MIQHIPGLDRYLTTEPIQSGNCACCGKHFDNIEQMYQGEDLDFCNEYCESRFYEGETLANLEPNEGE